SHTPASVPSQEQIERFWLRNISSTGQARIRADQTLARCRSTTDRGRTDSSKTRLHQSRRVLEEALGMPRYRRMSGGPNEAHVMSATDGTPAAQRGRSIHRVQPPV